MNTKLSATLEKELARIDSVGTTKRFEKIIEGFSNDPAPRALIAGRPYRVFNSNDYLGLRHATGSKDAEHEASRKYGTGPGAVRFISGSHKIHKDLEAAIAEFHGRQDAMIFSSAFATNLAVPFCLIKGQAQDSVVDGNTLVVSDELNHRSIIDGIRIAGLAKDQKAIFKHMDVSDLENILKTNQGKFTRVVVVTDGVFSMLGEYQDLGKMRQMIDQYQDDYKEGVILIVDDAHGVGAFGKTGRGVEEVSGGKADLLIGTFGKAFGADGGYVVGSKIMIDYLRESCATYIYSNSISPGTAGAALANVTLMQSSQGRLLLEKLEGNILHFKSLMQKAGFKFASQSSHPIQPILIADTVKTKQFKDAMFEAGILVTNINYPVVPKGKDEIRVQISATQTKEDIDSFVSNAKQVGKDIGLIS